MIGTVAVCDVCGNTFSWDHNVSVSIVKSILRDYGWQFGVIAACPDCLKYRKEFVKAKRRSRLERPNQEGE